MNFGKDNENILSYQMNVRANFPQCEGDKGKKTEIDIPTGWREAAAPDKASLSFWQALTTTKSTTFLTTVDSE